MPHVIAGNSAKQKDRRDVLALGTGLRRTAIGGAAELFASVAARPEARIFKPGGGGPFRRNRVLAKAQCAARAASGA